MAGKLRLSYLLLLVYCIFSFTSAYGIVFDSQSTWVVSKMSVNNDPNTWHPDHGNIDQEDSAASLTDVIQYVNDGDTILVFPGTYQESVDLSSINNISVIGVGNGVKIVSNTTHTFILGNHSTLENLDISYTDETQYCAAIFAENKDHLTVKKCRIEGIHYGMLLRNCTDTKLLESGVYAEEYTYVIGDNSNSTCPVTNHLIKDSTVVSKDWYLCANRALVLSGPLQVMVDHCNIIAMPLESNLIQHSEAVYVDKGWVHLCNCNIFSGITNDVGARRAVGITLSQGRIHCIDSSVDVSDLGDSYSIFNINGTCSLSKVAIDDQISGEVCYPK